MKRYRLAGQKFKCGLSPTGEPCALGPSGAYCPHRRDPQSNSCKPIRNLVWWSGTIQWTLAALALIGVSVAWTNIGRKIPLAPGPLSQVHAQLLNRSPHQAQSIDSSNRCAACHPNSGANVSSASVKQSDLCMECHRSKLPDATHGSPHDLIDDALQQLVARATPKQPSLFEKFVSKTSIDWQNQSTECSQCHREHGGHEHDLQLMTSKRCQACHQNQFHSFANGHPEFRSYPYDRQRSIAFDHAKHRDLHFLKKNAEFDCKTCHLTQGETGVVGQVFRSVGFEKACASCHAEPLKSAIQEGLLVLQVPSLNRKALMTAGVDIGLWPEQASQLTDGSIPPLMRMLLQSEPGGQELLAELPPSGKLADISLDTQQGRQTLQTLASVTKQLFQRMANEGQPGFRTSIGQLVSTKSPEWSVAPDSVTGRWLDRFSQGIPPDLFRAAWFEWFADPKSPALAFEKASNLRLTSNIKPVADQDLLTGGDSLLDSSQDLLSAPGSANASVNVDRPTLKDTRSWDQLSYGGWMIDRQRMAIVYVPKGHGDNWLSRWIELETLQNDPSQPSIVDANMLAVTQQCRQCHALPALTATTNSTTAESPSHLVSTSSTDSIRASMDSLDQDLCWKAKRRANNLRPITKFDHTPHLTLPAISDCQSCHRLESVQMSIAVEAGQPVSTVTEKFLPMQRSQCASCHRPDAAGDNCTQCHNYHVGTESWKASQY